MGLQLRPYQQKAIDQIQASINSGQKEIVLASAPSSGKTFIATEVIRNNTSMSFVILTHGTTILKNQWKKELDFHQIDASEGPAGRVIYGLPHSLKNMKLSRTFNKTLGFTGSEPIVDNTVDFADGVFRGPMNVKPDPLPAF